MALTTITIASTDCGLVAAVTPVIITLVTQQPYIDNGSVDLQRVRSTATAADGTLSVALESNAALSDATSTYTIQIGQNSYGGVVVPPTGPVTLLSLLPAVTIRTVIATLTSWDGSDTPEAGIVGSASLSVDCTNLDGVLILAQTPIQATADSGGILTFHLERTDQLTPVTGSGEPYWTFIVGSSQYYKKLHAAGNVLTQPTAIPAATNGSLSADQTALAADPLYATGSYPATPVTLRDELRKIAQSAVGTVTSVGLTAPAELVVGGSPVTGAGTFSITKAVQSPNTVWAGPTSGGGGAPTFRLPVPADIPNLDASKITTGTFAAGQVPVATTAAFGAVKPDGTTITISGGVISSAGGGGAIPAQPSMGGLADPTSADNQIVYRKASTVAALTLIGAGDSIEAGTAIATAPGVARAAALSIGGLTVTATNRGHAGATSADWIVGASSGYLAAVLADIATAVSAGHKPIVHYQIGTNDAKTAVATSAATYLTNVLSFARACVAAGAEVILAYPPYLNTATSSWDSTSTGKVAGYCGQIDLAVDNDAINQGDTSGQTFFAANTGDLQADGVHPTQAGSDRMAARQAAAMGRVVNAMAGQRTLAPLAIGAGLSVTPASGGTPATLTAGGGGGGGGGYGRPMTNGVASSPAILFNGAGDVVMSGG